jgi:hypothetical protein
MILNSKVAGRRTVPRPSSIASLVNDPTLDRRDPSRAVSYTPIVRNPPQPRRIAHDAATVSRKRPKKDAKNLKSVRF